jgi:6,7-dimethyl-8-ribityllumazine synthase
MILIVSSQFDKTKQNVIKDLENSCITELSKNKIDFLHVKVPGANEIPVTIKHFLNKRKYYVVIALGCIIKGESDHYDMIKEAVVRGITQISLEKNIPIIQGVLACHNIYQAKERKNLGKEYAESAIYMKNLFEKNIVID